MASKPRSTARKSTRKEPEAKPRKAVAQQAAVDTAKQPVKKEGPPAKPPSRTQIGIKGQSKSTKKRKSELDNLDPPSPLQSRTRQKRAQPVPSPARCDPVTTPLPQPPAAEKASPLEDDIRPKIRRKQVVRKVRIEDFNTEQYYPFISLKAKSTFEELIRGKQPIKERALDLKGDSPLIRSIIKSLGWEHFCGKPDEGGLQLVKEFYSNLVNQVGDKVFVRGVWINISSEEINRVIIAPNCEEDAYSEMMDKGIPPDVLTQKLCKKGEEVTWTTGKNNQPLSFPTSTLLPHLVPLLKFICCRLIPTTHTSDVTLDRAILLLAMAERRGVDAGWIISNNISESSSATKALWFPAIITKLCLAAGVQIAKGEEKVKAGLQIAMKITQEAQFQSSAIPSPAGTVNDELLKISTQLTKFISHQMKWNSFMKKAWQETLSSIHHSADFAGTAAMGGAFSSRPPPTHNTENENSEEEGSGKDYTTPTGGGKTISERFTTPSISSSNATSD